MMLFDTCSTFRESYSHTRAVLTDGFAFYKFILQRRKEKSPFGDFSCNYLRFFDFAFFIFDFDATFLFFAIWSEITFDKKYSTNTF